MARIRGGLVQSVSYADDDDRDTPSVTISLSQAPTAAEPWTLEVWCELRSGGSFLARRLVTAAPALGARTARVVAVGCVPGARRWEVIASAAAGAAADVQIVAAADAGGCCGVRAANDAAELAELGYALALAAAPSPPSLPLRVPASSRAAALRGNYTPAAIGGAASVAIETSRDAANWRPLAALTGGVLAFVGPIATPAAPALAVVHWALPIELPPGDRLVRFSAWESGAPGTPGALAGRLVAELAP